MDTGGRPIPRSHRVRLTSALEFSERFAPVRGKTGPTEVIRPPEADGTHGTRCKRAPDPLYPRAEQPSVGWGRIPLDPRVTAERGLGGVSPYQPAGVVQRVRRNPAPPRQSPRRCPYRTGPDPCSTPRQEAEHAPCVAPPASRQIGTMKPSMPALCSFTANRREGDSALGQLTSTPVRTAYGSQRG